MNRVVSTEHPSQEVILCGLATACMTQLVRALVSYSFLIVENPSTHLQLNHNQETSLRPLSESISMKRYPK
jgi:hypothetical protein